MEDRYHRGGHSKYCLRVHLVFVCKYRKKVLEWNIFADTLKTALARTAESAGVTIVAQETDRDHVHLLVDYPPWLSISSLVRLLKQQTA